MKIMGMKKYGLSQASPPILEEQVSDPLRPSSTPNQGGNRWVKQRSIDRWLHLGLLLLWIVLGTVLRFYNLTEKPLWTDEFSTIVFSLGHSYRTIPLDQVITSAQLLQPLQPDNQATLQSVIDRLFDESNHPPLYFLLTHLWLQLFPPGSNGLTSIWAVRSLSAICGVIAIPAIFVLGWQAFRSRIAGQFAAILMAVSPFAIYLSQEARHYTFPILWLILSLCCLVKAARTIRKRTPLPLWVCVTWVLVNGLGVASHYFFSLALVAEGLVIASLGLVQSWRERGMWYPSAHWRRIAGVAIGSLLSGLVWLPVWQDQDSELTRWIYSGDRSAANLLDPVIDAVAGWITMLYLLPIQAPDNAVVLASGIALIFLTVWTLPKIYWGLCVQCLRRETQLMVLVLGEFVLGAIALFFSITYFSGIELIPVFRYNFVYFPGIIVLLGAALASGWAGAQKIAQSQVTDVPFELVQVLRMLSRPTIILIVVLSLLGGLTVNFNLGYQKTHRPDVVAADIIRQSQAPVLVAIAHYTHGQTGRLMGVAWELQRKASQQRAVQGQSTAIANSNPNFNPSTTSPSAAIDPRFLLAHVNGKPQNVVDILRRALNQLPQPIDLWLVNFQGTPSKPLEAMLRQQRCQADATLDARKYRSIDGYRYRRYRCRKT